MIGSLRGTLLEISVRESPRVLMEIVDGVGYRVNVGKSTLDYLGEEGSEIFLHISHQVREDSEILYGFLDSSNRDAFELLLKMHKVGPVMAMDILDSYNLAQLQNIVMSQDVDALTDIKGVGAKTAERLLNELKDKLELDNVPLPQGTESAGLNDARRALVELGYSNTEIRSVLAELPSNLESEELLKQALSLLGPPTER